jgi:hypothetical protein
MLVFVLASLTGLLGQRPGGQKSAAYQTGYALGSVLIVVFVIWVIFKLTGPKKRRK